MIEIICADIVKIQICLILADKFICDSDAAFSSMGLRRQIKSEGDHVYSQRVKIRKEAVTVFLIL